MGKRPAGVAAGLLPAEDKRPAAGPAPGRDRAMRTARVLTVRRPRASAITYAGKDVENRTWPTDTAACPTSTPEWRWSPTTSCRQGHQFPAAPSSATSPSLRLGITVGIRRRLAPAPGLVLNAQRGDPVQHGERLEAGSNVGRNAGRARSERVQQSLAGNHLLERIEVKLRLDNARTARYERWRLRQFRPTRTLVIGGRRESGRTGCHAA